MTEIEKLEEFLATKSKNTAISYRRQYKVLTELLDKDVNTTAEKIIILALSDLLRFAIQHRLL